MNIKIKALYTLLIFSVSSVYPLYAGDPILEVDKQNLAIYYFIPLILLALLLMLSAKVIFNYKSSKQLGFLAITPHRHQKFYPFNENTTNMVPVVDLLADEQTNVYSNLSKITLAMKPNGVFLEDKNYKISILINRRRSRRNFLNDGDILDMGELTIMFKSPYTREKKHEQKSHAIGHVIPRSRRTHGKMIKNSPRLIPSETREKTFYLTKNITAIGRSEMNDLIPKSKAVSSMHSRIERVAGKYKLIDLNSVNGTFVNGRRIDSKMLDEGDEISFESMKYTFTMTEKTH